MKVIGRTDVRPAAWNGTENMRADREKTIAQQYLDYRSFMRSDGSEVLYEEDWKARVEELRRRCGGRCEEEGKYGRCRNEAADPHHVIRRSIRRDDRLENLLGLCRMHHDLLDERKIRSDKKE